MNGVQLVGTNFRKRCCRIWVQQGVGKVTGGLHVGIAGGLFWHRILVQEELDGLGCVFGAGIWNLVLVESVMFRSDTDVPAVYTMRCPGAAIGVGKTLAGYKRGRPLPVIPGADNDFIVDSPLMEFHVAVCQASSN